MGKKAEYKSSIRSRRLIKQAFIELMQEKNIEKITVTDIITRADINRGTFYAHYKDTRDVMEQIINEIIIKVKGFIGEMHYKNFFKDPMPLLSEISDWLKKDLKFYKILINSRGSEHFLAKLRDIIVKQIQTDSDIPEHIKKTPQFFIYTHFIAGGIINLYQVWLQGDIDNSIEEINLEISRILSNFSRLSDK